MIQVTLILSDFLLLMLGALLWAAASVAGALVLGGAAAWGCWRWARRR